MANALFVVVDVIVIGLALIVSGAIVLYAMRRALWRRLEEDGEPKDGELEAPPVERVHYVGPEDDLIDIPLDDGDASEYGSRPIYVPPERGTVYVSRGVDRD